jgi:hypothetical protein
VILSKRRGRVVKASSSYSGGPVVQISVRRPVMLTEVSRGLPQSLQANTGIVPYITAMTASFQIIYPIHHLLIILSFDAI